MSERPPFSDDPRWTDEEKKQFARQMWEGILEAVDSATGAYGPERAFRILLQELVSTARIYKLDGVGGRPKATISRYLRTVVLERDAYRCVFCEDWYDLEVDHIIPESLGGPTALENLQTLCRPCNRKKSDRLVGPA